MYYKTLLTQARAEYEINYGEVKIDTADEIRPITIRDVKETIREIRNRKAVGPGNISN